MLVQRVHVHTLSGAHVPYDMCSCAQYSRYCDFLHEAPEDIIPMPVIRIPDTETLIYTLDPALITLIGPAGEQSC